MALYSRGELVFWRALAYLAVFHFVRQQYGWMALYRARMGEHGCAFVRLLPGADAPGLDTVRAHLAAAGLARPKWPEELRLADDFPRTASGKVQKFVLRDRLRAEGG